MRSTATTLANKVWENGVLVNVAMGSWSMEARLKSKDVGLDHVKEDVIKLGHKRLMPKREKNVFANIRTKVSQLFAQGGFSWMMDGSYYVPNTNLNSVLEKLQEFQKDYNEKADVLVANYEKFRQEWFETHPEYVEILEPYYPMPEEVRSKYYFRFYVYKVRESLEDVEVASGMTIQEGDYTLWLQESINDLRNDVKRKVEAIQNTIIEGRLDNRLYTRIRKVKDQLIALDMNSSEALKEAVAELENNPTVATTKAVIKNATPLTTQQVRKLFL